MRLLGLLFVVGCVTPNPCPPDTVFVANTCVTEMALDKCEGLDEGGVCDGGHCHDGACVAEVARR